MAQNLLLRYSSEEREVGKSDHRRFNLKIINIVPVLNSIKTVYFGLSVYKTDHVYMGTMALNQKLVTLPRTTQ